MMTFLAPYRKFVAYVIAIAALLALEAFDISVPGVDAIILQLIVGALGGFGVYQVTNENV